MGMKGALKKMMKLQVATDQECNCMIRILVIFKGAFVLHCSSVG